MHHPISLEKSLSYEGDFFVPCRPSSPEPLFSGEVCDLQIKEYGRFRTSARSVPWGMTVRGRVINVLFDNRGQMQEFHFTDAKNNIIATVYQAWSRALGYIFVTKKHPSFEARVQKRFS